MSAAAARQQRSKGGRRLLQRWCTAHNDEVVPGTRQRHIQAARICRRASISGSNQQPAGEQQSQAQHRLVS